MITSNTPNTQWSLVITWKDYKKAKHQQKGHTILDALNDIFKNAVQQEHPLSNTIMEDGAIGKEETPPMPKVKITTEVTELNLSLDAIAAINKAWASPDSKESVPASSSGRCVSLFQVHRI
jgi:hypothetical protein